MEKGVNAGLVGLQALNQVLTEAVHAVGEDAHAVEQVADHDGLEDVQLELAVHAADGGGDVVTHNLGADHGEGLALGGVDLAGHDGATGLVLGQDQLAEAAAGAGAEVADILGDLEQGAGEGVERAEASTMASWAARASNLLGAVLNSVPVILVISAAMASRSP